MKREDERNEWEDIGVVGTVRRRTLQKGGLEACRRGVDVGPKTGLRSRTISGRRVREDE